MISNDFYVKMTSRKKTGRICFSLFSRDKKKHVCTLYTETTPEPIKNSNRSFLLLFKLHSFKNWTGDLPPDMCLYLVYGEDNVYLRVKDKGEFRNFTIAKLNGVYRGSSAYKVIDDLTMVEKFERACSYVFEL